MCFFRVLQNVKQLSFDFKAYLDNIANEWNFKIFVYLDMRVIEYILKFSKD